VAYDRSAIEFSPPIAAGISGRASNGPPSEEDVQGMGVHAPGFSNQPDKRRTGPGREPTKGSRRLVEDDGGPSPLLSRRRWCLSKR